MSAIVSKATGLFNSAVAKSTQLANCAVYWGKVGAEVGKIVYKQEGLAPPSQAQFKQVYNNFVKFLQTPSEQKAALEAVTKFQPNKQNLSQLGIYSIHVLAFFSVGEIIGRRSLFGYPVAHAEHH
ncbi:uncharacterized protein CXQ87_002007 [Candidozyma duobushaemuli]|nr:uncharacterized protein CXQ87_002007 [[Candida] duobushaemulonis]PVH13889.1 hypothetical protein CXQ87_002007 [[Candida] duobushaemulonis]